jgi:hypothetical protein
MKRTYLGKYLVLAIFLGMAASGILFSTSRAEAAFGISPPFLNADHLTQGSTYTQTLYLVRDDSSADLPVVANINVPQNIAGWVTIDQGSKFIIPAGTQQFPVTVTIKVPQNAALAKYTGDLSFTTVPNQTGEVSIALGVNVALNLTVGNDVFEQFSVPLIQVLDIEEGWNPRVYLKFDNEGNIPEAFDSATFELFDQYDSVRLAYLEKQNGFPTIAAFTKSDYTVEFPSDLHLGTGDYWGNVTFYQNGKVVASQKMAFRVLPAGTLSGWWGKVSYAISSNKWVLLAILVLIGAIVGFVVRRSRRRHAE